MDLRLTLTTMTSSLGDVIEFEPTGITCIVGPNNVGKSKLLRELRNLLVEESQETPVVLRDAHQEYPLSKQIGQNRLDQMSLGRWQPEEDHEIIDWLRNRSGAYGVDYNGAPQYSAPGGGGRITPSQLVQGCYSNRISPTIAPFFLDSGAVGQSQLSGNFQPMDGEGELDASYLAAIHRSSETEARISSIFAEVFGKELVYDQATGFNGLRIGLAPVSLLDNGRFTDEYTKEMRSLPKLSQQGSGMQAFLGPVSAITMGCADLYLLDEPETYLHPPQARALGKIVGREAAARRKQVILVTHDRDLVIGLLESGANLQFIRVAREGDGNRLSHVRTNDIESIWSSAMLRYSGVLSGLFYRHVVVCESDADCRFYSATLDDLLEDGEVDRTANETLFVPASGKSGVTPRVRALSKLHVSVSVVLDIDVLLDEPRLLRKIIDALGQQWIDLDSTQFNTVKSFVIERGLREAFKSSGVSILSSGPVTQSAIDLLDRLATRGVHIIRVGEMESFNKNILEQKDAWVDTALAADFHRSPGPHRLFVKEATEPPTNSNPTSAVLTDGP